MLKSALLATGVTAALLATGLSASAQGQDTWDLRERTAYVVMMDGTTRTMAISDRGMAMLTRHARRVPRGMVFFMNNGQLYMTNAAAMFDRASGGALFAR